MRIILSEKCCQHSIPENYRTKIDNIKIISYYKYTINIMNNKLINLFILIIYIQLIVCFIVIYVTLYMLISYKLII